MLRRSKKGGFAHFEGGKFRTRAIAPVSRRLRLVVDWETYNFRGIRDVKEEYVRENPRLYTKVINFSIALLGFVLHVSIQVVYLRCVTYCGTD